MHRLTVLLCVLGPLPLGDYQITGSTDATRVIVLRDDQALVSAPDRIQVLASHARLVLSDAEQLTQQPADLLQVRDQAALLLADGT